MPDYTIRDAATGRTLTVRGDSPPTDAESAELFDKSAPSGGSAVTTGLALGGASKMAPAATRAVEAIATSPTLAKTAGKVGNFVGGVGPAVAEILSGNPTGALAAAAAAGKTSWAGGKSAYFTAKFGQRLALPFASALAKLEPYAKGILGTAGGVQSGLDLAQLAEPNRKDIGIAGGGASLTPEEETAINVAAIHQMVERGQPPAQAAAAISGKDPRKFAAIMKAYADALKQHDIELPAATP